MAASERRVEALENAVEAARSVAVYAASLAKEHGTERFANDYVLPAVEKFWRALARLGDDDAPKGDTNGG